MKLSALPCGRGRPPGRSGGARLRLGGRARLVLLGIAAVLAAAFPALAEYLGPDRTTVEEVVVRDPDHDVWTLTHVDPFDGYSDVCLVLHTCDEHPSVERQAALCGWVADNSGCEEAYRTELRTTTLLPATVSEDLRDCSLHGGWCSGEPTLHLTGVEPLAGYEITGVEGTRNGEPFFCAGDACDVPLLEGENTFSFWALSSYGDSSLMGTLSARVDSSPPSTVFLQPADGTTVAVAGEVTIRGVSADAVSGLAAVEISRDGSATWLGLPFESGGTWSYPWDTRRESEGVRLVLARSWDNAGHGSGSAHLSFVLDRTPPQVDLPDAWPIWQEPRLRIRDSGSGIATVFITIDGGRYGIRRWEYRSPDPGRPLTIAWDRRFGEIIAPIGEYPVEVEAWDRAGNRGTDKGLLLIPDPGPSPALAGPIVEEEAASPPVRDFVAGPPVLPHVSELVEGLNEPPKREKEPRLAIREEAAPLWGPAALAAAALVTAEVLRRRRDRVLAEGIRLEALRRRAASAASPGALASRLARLRRRAERVVAPLRAAILSAAAAAEAAPRTAQQVLRRQRGRADAVEAIRAGRPARVPIDATPPQGDSWQRIEVLRAQPRGGGAPTPSHPPNPFLEPLRFLRENAHSARQALRGYAIYNLLRAARHVTLQRVTTTLRVFGPRIDRMRLGLREMVNSIRPENIRLLPQTPVGRAVRSLKSWGVAFGLGLNLATDTADYLEGGSDREEFAAALTIDTGITIAAALVGGAVAGGVSGMVVGWIGGSAVPVAGNITGAALGGAVGAIAGIVVASLVIGAVYSSGTRSFLAEKVADLYRTWTEPTAGTPEDNR